MGLTHFSALVKLKVNPLFQGVTCISVRGCKDVMMWLCYCGSHSVDVTCVTITCTHVVCQIMATPSCTNGVVPVYGRPWYPPVWIPALISINQSSNLSAKSCLLAVPWALGALYGSRSTYKVAQCTNIHRDNCCHPLDVKTLFQSTMAVPVIVTLVTKIRKNHRNWKTLAASEISWFTPIDYNLNC